jgi:hypothetical protein
VSLGPRDFAEWMPALGGRSWLGLGGEIIVEDGVAELVGRASLPQDPQPVGVIEEGTQPDGELPPGGQQDPGDNVRGPRTAQCGGQPGPERCYQPERQADLQHVREPQFTERDD